MDDDIVELERDVYREVGEAIRAARKGLGLTLEQQARGLKTLRRGPAPRSLRQEPRAGRG